jgi:hypothetical protein|tara:strand:+ start:447 stop:605 length:159 start_codon:yes stop_codon:yes gene_type:complete
LEFQWIKAMPDAKGIPGADASTYRLPDCDYVGEGWTPAQPGIDPVLYGPVQE